MLILDSETFQIIRIYKWYDHSSFINNAGSTIAYNKDQNVWFLFSFLHGYYFVLFNSSYDIEKATMFYLTVKLDFSSHRYFYSIINFKHGKVYLSFAMNLLLGINPYSTMSILSIPTDDIDTSWFNNIYSKEEILDVS